MFNKKDVEMWKYVVWHSFPGHHFFPDDSIGFLGWFSNRFGTVSFCDIS